MVWREQLIELIKLGPQKFFVRQHRLVFRYQRRRQGTAQGVLDNLAVLCGTEQHPNGGIFVLFAVVTVERFEHKLQLAEMIGFESSSLEFEGHEAVQPPMKEKQIERKIPPPHLQRILRADE